MVEASIPRRTVVLKGTVAQMNQAFQVDLGTYETQEEKYRGREGAISVPANIAPIVEGIFGLDNRKMAQPMNVRSAQKVTQGGPGQATVPLTPPQVGKTLRNSGAAGRRRRQSASSIRRRLQLHVRYL